MAAAKTVLVTGTSTGIGLETAVQAARAGWHVVATMRDESRAGRLWDRASDAGVSGSVSVRALDVTDPASVARCLDAVRAERGGLDALVNNAGAGHVGTVEDDSLDATRATFEVNFFGVVQVTKAAMPLLRASRGRLVTVTSVGGVVGQPFNEAYCAAKFAVEGFMEALHPVAATVGVAVCVVEPGAVASEFVASVGRAGYGVDADGPYAAALAGYLDRARTSFSAAQSAEEAAASVVELLTAEVPPFRIQSSSAARAFVGVKLADLDGSAVTGLTAGWVGQR